MLLISRLAGVLANHRENGKEGEGYVAGSTDAAANFNPVVSFIMRRFAPPAVPGNRIAQVLRTSARDLLVAASSPVEIWVARIRPRRDKENRTEGDAPPLYRSLGGFRQTRG